MKLVPRHPPVVRGTPQNNGQTASIKNTDKIALPYTVTPKSYITALSCKETPLGQTSKDEFELCGDVGFTSLKAPSLCLDHLAPHVYMWHSAHSAVVTIYPIPARHEKELSLEIGG